MSLFDASVHTVRGRVRSLQADMKRWMERASATGDLRQHNSQLTRLHDRLDSALMVAVAGRPIDLEVHPPFDGEMDEVPDYRRCVGSVHMLWEFFRDKLAQREMDAFAAHLGVGDDLAWACYEPFLTAATLAHPENFAAAAVKEPPLVFFSTDRTPFAQARTKTLHPAGLDAKDLEDFATELQRLPVPVIGMPWDVANRMPETTLIGHEVGHVIAEDLGLAAEAREAVQGADLADDPSGTSADGSRKGVWLAWSDEVFADVIGALTTGTAFVEGLTAEMAGGRDEIRLMPIDTGRPGKYPTPVLRVALCDEVLAAIGVSPPTGWWDTYGKQIVGNSRDFADDVPVIATALLGRQWDAIGGKRLTDILPWDAQHEADARKVAAKTLLREAVPVAFDVRRWVAAAMHAYRADPDTYTDLDLDDALATHIVRQRTAGVRSSRSLREQLIGPDEAPQPVDRAAQLRAADRRAGAELAERLKITRAEDH
jgi:hypothetical protein